MKSESGKMDQEKCNISKNSVASNILFVVTVLEWQAEHLKPAIFDSSSVPNSLTRAIKAQWRDFASVSKPYQFKNILDG